jgi:voltage-gated potassium channel
MTRARTRLRIWRRRIYGILEHEQIGDRPVRLVSGVLVTLVMINIAAVVLESVPRFALAFGGAFTAIETLSLAVFTLEYLLRIWAAPEHAPTPKRTPLRARLQYMLSAEGLVDLVSVLPFWLAFTAPSELRIVLMFRIVRFLKLTRYSPALRSLLAALYAERRALSGCVVILAGMTLVSGVLVHLAERHVQPEEFGTIPDAMWWALVTLGTVGYGDAVPVTAAGRLIATLTILCSFVMVGLPVGIIATAFSEQIHRRDFVVTWSMVARVPLFAGLDAAEIADITRLLRAQTVDAGDVIARRGEEAHSMYFIAGGKVDIALPGRHVSLGVGHFFGEIAVLHRARRSATVTAVSRASLLVLDASDFHLLMERDQRIAERVHAVVRQRTGLEAVSPSGDIAAGELSGAEEEPDS